MRIPKSALFIYNLKAKVSILKCVSEKHNFKLHWDILHTTTQRGNSLIFYPKKPEINWRGNGDFRFIAEKNFLLISHVSSGDLKQCVKRDSNLPRKKSSFQYGPLQRDNHSWGSSMESRSLKTPYLTKLTPKTHSTSKMHVYHNKYICKTLVISNALRSWMLAYENKYCNLIFFIRIIMILKIVSGFSGCELAFERRVAVGCPSENLAFKIFLLLSFTSHY